MRPSNIDDGYDRFVSFLTQSTITNRLDEVRETTKQTETTHVQQIFFLHSNHQTSSVEPHIVHRILLFTVQVLDNTFQNTLINIILLFSFWFQISQHETTVRLRPQSRGQKTLCSCRHPFCKYIMYIRRRPLIKAETCGNVIHSRIILNTIY